MSRRRKPPFSQEHKITLLKDKKDPNKKTIITLGGPPKRLTRGLARQLEIVKRQNPQEFERQRALLPSDAQATLDRKLAKKVR